VVGSQVPYANDTVYMVVIPSTTATSGMCTSWCGYHDSFTVPNSKSYNANIRGQVITYGLVPSPLRCNVIKGGYSGSCGGSTYNKSPGWTNATSPNGNTEVDDMVSILSHEFAETVSDGYQYGWTDAFGDENGDKCAWDFGGCSAADLANSNVLSCTYTNANNAVEQVPCTTLCPNGCAATDNSTYTRVNMVFNSGNGATNCWLIQRLWSNVKGSFGGCGRVSSQA